jgi:VanZ family protein
VSENKTGKRLVYGMLTLSVMAAIFWFSAQPGDESMGISDGFLAWILSGKVPFLSWFAQTTGIFEWLSIRKCAHMFVYFLLGIFAALTAGTWEPSVGKRIWLPWLVSVLYACSDEWHQRFVPGRSCAWRDVGIDAAGALAGVLLVFLFWKIRAAKNKEVR